MELVWPSKRRVPGMLIQLFFSAGVVRLAVGRAGVAGVRALRLAAAPDGHHGVSGVLLPGLERGRFDKARATVMTAAKVNGKTVPEAVLSAVMRSFKTVPEAVLSAVMPAGRFKTVPEAVLSAVMRSFKTVPEVVLSTVMPAGSFSQLDLTQAAGEDDSDGLDQVSGGESPGTNRLVDLFASRKLCVRTCVLFFNWTVVSLTYYGLTFNTGKLGARLILLNFLLAGLLELPVHTTAILTIDRRNNIPGAAKNNSSVYIVSTVLLIIILYALEIQPPIMYDV
ncbi:hypothetical protein EGW08_017265 [Elysia chlorotica]|uniref:Uncharacterized protein n=1 Tax=Elysia chlorotica TaxID=188477 RepID=A0A3S1B354_ELYCH|nr:hypothetical protein EGW08_017265 [Elysia chlorotica]